MIGNDCRTPRETSRVGSYGTKTHFTSEILLWFVSCLLGKRAVYIGTQWGSALLLNTGGPRNSIGNTLREDRSSGRYFSSTILVTPANFLSTILIYFKRWPGCFELDKGESIWPGDEGKTIHFPQSLRLSHLSHSLTSVVHSINKRQGRNFKYVTRQTWQNNNRNTATKTTKQLLQH